MWLTDDSQSTCRGDWLYKLHQNYGGIFCDGNDRRMMHFSMDHISDSNAERISIQQHSLRGDALSIYRKTSNIKRTLSQSWNVPGLLL